MHIENLNTDKERIKLSGVWYDYEQFGSLVPGQGGWCQDRGGNEGRQPATEQEVRAYVLSKCFRQYLRYL